MSGKEKQNCCRTKNIIEQFEGIPFFDREIYFSESEDFSGNNNKQDNVDNLKVNVDQIRKENKPLYLGIMRKCDVEEYLRSFIGTSFGFYHNFKASKTFIKYPRTLKLYYVFKNEVDLIVHSEIKYRKTKNKFTIKIRTEKRKSFDSFEELVEYCKNGKKGICC
ncbi:Hypothetical protein SRAE_2000310000 [Strongyloides ratti]|uniref:SH2 domain-containing protein n=1 Tax=Strongyloides ratti TaxID=34506 RepID=A0A090LJY0_STRRB|nr:Hypothetical protein SRAE_2000310000 [Strongyloides ratti]CEF68443.1 Hypothetical protein SRAE_2000310000 [Strongyloides ratti]